ncbi:GTPase IMAP family member 8-like [Genypterus blacodes]|uniref:GTPase IMAP family member 8-like n=1 Tax=Genypterus blacodes TaxID=154954 RepID=UPI003F7596FD
MTEAPDFISAHMDEENLSEFLSCTFECLPHAFLLVLKVEMFTQENKDAVNEILQYFSEEALKYTVVVFTHGHRLDKKMDIEKFVCKNRYLRDLLRKCGDRCHVIDSQYWRGGQRDEYRNNRFQVKNLLITIEKMVKENEGACRKALRDKSRLTLPGALVVGAPMGALLGGAGAALILKSLHIALTEAYAAVPYVCAGIGAAAGGATAFRIAGESRTPQDAAVKTAKALGRTGVLCAKTLGLWWTLVRE